MRTNHNDAVRVPFAVALCFAVCAVGGSGCGTKSGQADTSEATDEADAPSLGKADARDAADHDCRVVLRELRQPQGLPTHHADGVDWVVFEGVVDAKLGENGIPVVLYRSEGYSGWREVATQSVFGAPEGFLRFQFVLDDKTVPVGDNLAWANMKIEVIPFLRISSGGSPLSRLFDHNRNADDFTNYVLSASSSTVADDPQVCPGKSAQTGDSCPPERVSARGDCEQSVGHFWNGVFCGELIGCDCEGKDCDKIHPTRQACLDAHVACAPPSGVDPETFHGDTCYRATRTAAGACRDDFNDQELPDFCCDLFCLYMDPERSPVLAQECLPQRASGMGTCEESLHKFAWDGVRCLEMGGCGCEGPDCDKLYATEEECAAAYAGCEPPAGIDPNTYSSSTCTHARRAATGECFYRETDREAPDFCCSRYCFY